MSKVIKKHDTFDIAFQRQLRIEAIKAERNRKNKDYSTLSELIDYFNLEATQQDIEDWREARLLAIDYDRPDWTDLIRVFDDVMVDAFLSGIINTIKDIVKSRKLNFYSSAGKQQDTDIFAQKWFFDFLDFVTEAFFYPFSVIELGDMVDNKFKKIKMIPREYFVPQHTFVKKSLYTYGQYKHMFDGWDITEKELNKYYIYVRSNEKLGLLDKVAYHVIGKKNMLIYSWRFAEKLGIPIAAGHTDMHDPARRANMENMLSNLGSSLWAVMDKEDLIELIEAKSPQSNSNIFKDLKDSSNFEISVALAGSESIFKDKAFVGSAEVGERIFELRQKSILRNVLFVINNDLIPRMVLYGIPVNGWYAEWENEENVSYDNKIKAVQALTPYFEMDADEVGEKLGWSLKPKTMKTPPEQQTMIEDIKNRKPSSIMPEVSALYSKVLKAPLPQPGKNERKKDFMDRCMGDAIMVNEYPDQAQRYQICQTQIEKRNG